MYVCTAGILKVELADLRTYHETHKALLQVCPDYGGCGGRVVRPVGVWLPSCRTCPVRGWHAAATRNPAVSCPFTPTLQGFVSQLLSLHPCRLARFSIGHS
jgi:hypothetical protein